MKFLLLFSGSVRTLHKNINIIEKLMQCANIEYDIYLYFGNDPEDKYNTPINYEYSFLEKFKLIVNDNNIPNFPTIINNFPTRVSDLQIKNTFKQWYKLHKLFSFVIPDSYDYIIRIRPDIEILNSQEEFLKILNNLSKDTMYIPSISMHDTDIITCFSEYDQINDQFCICSYNLMKIYANFYLKLLEYPELPFISEIILHHYLKLNKINIAQINIKYKLNLSLCNIIAISGDSGTGKSTLMNFINSLCLFDKYLCFETDRYHKWEREDVNWKQYTHLDPYSNYLEKMSDDTFNLKIGNSIYAIDYDHCTGKFTRDSKIQSENGVIICGLHTLYERQMLRLVDIKIFVDTDQNLKIIWKLRRDTKKRNQTLETILESIKKRENDYIKYIKPQKENADIIINYYSDESLCIEKYNEYNNINIKHNVFISEKFYNQNDNFKSILEFEKINNVYLCKIKYNEDEIKKYIYSKYRIEIEGVCFILGILLILHILK